MEWMLQVVDELDDAVGALRHRVLGFGADIGLAAAGTGALAAVGAALLQVIR